MEPLPDDVALGLLRGLGAYIQATPVVELPVTVRRFKGFRSTGLARHRDTILQMLSSAAERALLLQWLDEEKPALSKDDAAILRIACERKDGWREALLERSHGPEPLPKARERSDALDKERAKTRKARDDLRRLRSEMERAAAQAAARLAEAERAAAELQAALDAQTERAEAAEVALERARSASERELRRAAKAQQSAAATAARLRAELKALKPLTVPAGNKSTLTRKKPVRRRRSGPRTPLKVARGRREDDPATLEAWLDRDDVHLLIDGYNVTKAGYPELSLEAQRERLTIQASNLATRKKVRGTIVFDGSADTVRLPKAVKGPMRIVFSRKGEIADDRLIAILKELPPAPVVLVTNDRELRERAAERGATLASSEQLLGLLR